MEAKNLLKSRTFWFNVLAGIGTILAPDNPVADTPITGQEVAGVVTVVGNIIFRLLTGVPVKFKF